MSLRLPIILDLRTCCKPPKQIQYSQEIHFTDETQNNYETQQLIKSYLPVQRCRYYPELFAKIFLLIKINSLAAKQCDVNHLFIQQLKQVYNSANFDKIQISNTQAQIMSQIISKIATKVSLNTQEYQNIIQGNALLASSAVWLAQKAWVYLRKQQIAFCLSFVALGGRKLAFTPIVHQQKNHAGQIQFAKRINELLQTQQMILKMQQNKVQDPYSMRCSPQVHGVAYDCLTQLKCNIHSLINKPHFKYISIKGKKIQNLLLQSDTYSLKMDFLICSLQQIGAMSFLRLQRILNSFLGKNKLKEHKQYTNLYSMMHSALSMTSQNKILSEMTNFDTANINSYNNDIFYSPGAYFNKMSQLFYNLYYIMTTEILSSLAAFKDISEGNPHKIEFINKEMHGHYDYLRSAVSPWKKTDSLRVVQKLWMQ